MIVLWLLAVNQFLMATRELLLMYYDLKRRSAKAGAGALRLTALEYRSIERLATVLEQELTQLEVAIGGE